jgi:hypothetical protein
MINIRALLTLGTKGTDKAKKEVSDVNKQLDQAADNAERMNRTLSQTKTGKSAMERAGVTTQDYRTQRSVTGARGAEGRNFSGLASAGDSQGFVAAYATLAANIFAVTAAFQALSNAARTEQLAAGLDLVGARAGVALGITSKGLQEVTDYALTSADAMRVVASATAAGFKADEIERLGAVAKGASVALGRDLGDSMDRLIKGTIKLEPELLDELGIMTRLDDAVKNYALANNKAVSSLTQTERRQAFLNAVLEEGEQKFGDISEQIEANPYDKLAASVKDFGTEVLKVLNNVLMPFIKLLTEVPMLGITIALGVLNQTLGKVLPNLDSISGKVGLIGGNLQSKLGFTEALIPEAEAQVITAKSGSKDETAALKEYNKLERERIGLQARILANEKQSKIIANFREDVKTKGIISASKELLIAQASLLVERQRVGEQTKLTALTTVRAAMQTLATGASLVLAGISGVLTVITLVVTAIMMGAAAFKFFFPPSELNKRLDESKKNMKELAEQTEKTIVQLERMLEPGKMQSGAAFDAIVKSAKAAQEELNNYASLKKRIEGADEEAPTIQLSGKDFLQTESEALKLLSGTVARNTNASKEQRDLLMSQFKLRLTLLSKEERALEISKAYKLVGKEQINFLEEQINSTAKISATFSDISDAGKNISKYTKEMFPAETVSAAAEIASSYNQILTTIAAGPKEGQESAIFNRAIAESILEQSSNIQQNISSLKVQGLEIKGHEATLSNINDLQAARSALQQATINGTDIERAQASDLFEEALNKLALDSEGVKLLLQALGLNMSILGTVEKINAEKLKVLNLEMETVKLSGDNAKNAAMLRKTLQDSKILALGVDIKIPEELTLDYRIEIAKIEEQTAQKIADIKLQTLALEASQRDLELASSEDVLRDKLRTQGGAIEIFGSEDAEARLRGFIKYSEDASIRERANTQLNLLLTEKQRFLNQEVLKLSQDAANAERSKASSVTNTLIQTKQGISLNKRNAKYALEELNSKKELQNILNKNADSLSMGVKLSNQATSLLRATELPLLEQKQILMDEEVKSLEDLINEEETFLKLSAEKQRFYREELILAKDKADGVKEELKGVNAIIDSAKQGLIQQAAALDIEDKKLALLKEQASAMKTLRDAELNLIRARAEGAAKAQGRSLAKSEEGKLRAREVISEIESIGARRNPNEVGPPTKEQSLSQIALLEDERDLLIKRSNLEEQLFKIKFESARLDLQNSIATSKKLNKEAMERGEAAPISEKSISASESALASFEGLLPSFMGVFELERNSINANFDLRVQALEATAKILGIELQGIAQSSQEVMRQLSDELKNDMSGVFTSAMGYTGRVASTFASESTAIAQGTGDRNQKEADLKALRETSNEMQIQQTLAEGLQSTFDNLGASMSDAFSGLIDGSKSAKEAFAELALSFLKSIADMISKIIAFTISMMVMDALMPSWVKGFLNLMGGGIPIPVPGGEAAAAGGIIPLATGGVMDRAMGVQGIIKKPTYLVGEGRHNEAVVPLPNGRSIPVQMHGGGSQSNNVAVTVNLNSEGAQAQTDTQGQDMSNLGSLIASAVQKELMAQKMPGGILNRYGSA